MVMYVALNKALRFVPALRRLNKTLGCSGGFKRTPLTALLFALFATACAPSPSATSDQPSLAVASDAYFLASRTADAGRAESLLAEEHIFVGPTGKVQDKAARVAWLRENKDWLPSVSTKDVEVTQFGQTGRVTGIWLIPDGGIVVHERFVIIWALQGGRWQMISHQVTEVPEQSRDGT